MRAPNVCAPSLRAERSNPLFGCGGMDCFAPLAMTPRCASAISPHVLREVCHQHSPSEHQRAQGMPGAGCARSLACKIKKHTSIVTTVTPESPGIPYAMVLTVSFVISSVTGLVCHRRRRNRNCFRRLDTSVGASGPHDFAVRLSAVRPQPIGVHRIPFPTSVTIASRPSLGTRRDA